MSHRRREISIPGRHNAHGAEYRPSLAIRAGNITGRAQLVREIKMSLRLTEEEYRTLQAHAKAARKAPERGLETTNAPRNGLRPVQTEEQEQMALIAWAQLWAGTYPELGLLAHFPNGGSRHIVEAVKFRRMGVLPGIPDLVLFAARHNYHAWLGEMKSAKGTLSAHQKKVIGALRKAGYFVGVFRSWTEARDSLLWYLRREKL